MVGFRQIRNEAGLGWVRCRNSGIGTFAVCDSIPFMPQYAKFLAALISGLGATATIFAAPRFQRSTGTDLSRMRGDVERVGATMRAVIERERVERKTARIKTEG